MNQHWFHLNVSARGSGCSKRVVGQKTHRKLSCIIVVADCGEWEMGSGRGQCDICVCQREAAWLFLEVTRTAFRIRLSRRTFNLTIPTPQSPNPISWFNVGPVSGPTINQQRVFHTGRQYWMGCTKYCQWPSISKEAKFWRHATTGI